MIFRRQFGVVGVVNNKKKKSDSSFVYTNHHVVSQYLNIFNSFNRFEVSEVNADSSEDISGLRLLMATFRQLRNPIQVLLIPITMWSGFEQGFFVADFTAVGL